MFAGYKCLLFPATTCQFLTSMYSRISAYQLDITQKFQENDVFKVLGINIPEACFPCSWVLVDAMTPLVGSRGKATDGVNG